MNSRNELSERPMWLHCKRGKLRFMLLFPSGYDAVAFAEIRELTGFRLTAAQQSGTQPKRQRKENFRRINRV